MEIIKRLGIGGGGDSSGRNSCPDILELDTGDYIVVGTDVTDVMKDNLSLGAKCAEYEKIVKIPRYILTSAKKDIME